MKVSSEVRKSAGDPSLAKWVKIRVDFGPDEKVPCNSDLVSDLESCVEKTASGALKGKAPKATKSKG